MRKLLCLALLISSAFAFAAGPTGGAIQGTLLAPGGTPVTLPSVSFKVQIWDKTATCMLYEETHSALDLSATNGDFSFDLGFGTSRLNNVDGTTDLKENVFRNDVAIAADPLWCAGGLTFTSGDERLIRVHYDVGGGFTAMTPDMRLQGGVYSVVAETLQGKEPTDFVTIRDDVTYDLNQANVENIFSAVNYAKLNALLNGSASFSMGNQRITDLATPTLATDAATKSYTDNYVGGKSVDVTGVGPGVNSNHTLLWDGAQNKWVTGVPNDSTKLPLAGGTMTGAIAMAAQNITNIGYMTMAAQRTLHLGTFTDAQETTLIATPLAAGDEGKTWYNSDGNVLKVWDGTRAVVQASTASGGQLDSTMIPANVLLDGGNSRTAILNVGSNDAYAVNIETAGTPRITIDATGFVGIGTTAPTTGTRLDITGTGATASSIIVPRDTTANRPATGVNGMIRYNSTLDRFEGYEGGAWTNLSGSGLGDFKADGTVPMTGAFEAIDGTAAAPGIAFDSQVNTGIYRPSANQIGFAANGALALKILGSSNAYIGSGISRMEMGTETGPAHSFENDNNTGMYNVAADTLGFATNGSEKMRISSAGYVGIGATTPARLLHVQGPMRLTPAALPGTPGLGDIAIDSGDGNKLKYYNGSWQTLGTGTGSGDFKADGTVAMTGNIQLNGNYLSNDGNDEGIFVDTSGNVGVGHSSPLFKLDVESTWSSGAAAALFRAWSNANNNVQEVISVSAHSPGAPTAGHGASIGIRGTTDGSSRREMAIIGAVFTDVTDSSRDTDLFFTTATNANGVALSTEKMRLTSAGYLGIGTSTPSVPLDVVSAGSVATESILAVRNPSTAAYSTASFDFYTANAWKSSVWTARENLGSGAAFGISTADSSGTAVERLRITEAGYVGIGTTNPTYALDVTGTMRVTGQAYTTSGDGSFTVLSDARYKNVHGSYRRGLEDILNVNTIRYNYLANNPMGSDPSVEFVGVTAQNLQTAVPEAVKEKDGYLTLNTSPVLWALVNAVKELYNRIVGIDREVASVKAESTAKDQRIKILEQENMAIKVYLCSKDPNAPLCK